MNTLLVEILKIGEVARLSNLPIKTIRYYEDLGLLAPTVERSDSGYRLFHAQVLQRLAFIKRAQALGLRLDEIQTILGLYNQGQTPCPEVKQQLQAKMHSISQQIAALEALQSELAELLDSWQEQPTTTVDQSICPNIQK